MRHDKRHRDGRFAPSSKPAVSALHTLRFEGGMEAATDNLYERARSAQIAVHHVPYGSLPNGRVGEMDHNDRTIKLGQADDVAEWRRLALFSHEAAHAFDPWLQANYRQDVDYRDKRFYESRNETVAMLASMDYCHAYGLDLAPYTHRMLSKRKFADITKSVRLRADMAVAHMLPPTPDVMELRRKTSLAWTFRWLPFFPARGAPRRQSLLGPTLPKRDDPFVRQAA